MNAESPLEREEKAASEPEAGAMVEKRASARAASGSSVSAGSDFGRFTQPEAPSQGRLGGVAAGVRGRLMRGWGLGRLGMRIY